MPPPAPLHYCRSSQHRSCQTASGSCFAQTSPRTLNSQHPQTCFLQCHHEGTKHPNNTGNVILVRLRCTQPECSCNPAQGAATLDRHEGVALGATPIHPNQCYVPQQRHDVGRRLPGMLSSTKPTLTVRPCASTHAPSSFSDALDSFSTLRLLFDSSALARYPTPSSPSPLNPRSRYVSTQRLCFRAIPRDRPAAASRGFHLRGHSVTVHFRVQLQSTRSWSLLMVPN